MKKFAMTLLAAAIAVPMMFAADASKADGSAPVVMAKKAKKPKKGKKGDKTPAAVKAVPTSVK